jgi:hypothetical protein
VYMVLYTAAPRSWNVDLHRHRPWKGPKHHPGGTDILNPLLDVAVAALDPSPVTPGTADAGLPGLELLHRRQGNDRPKSWLGVMAD